MDKPSQRPTDGAANEAEEQASVRYDATRPASFAEVSQLRVVANVGSEQWSDAGVGADAPAHQEAAVPGPGSVDGGSVRYQRGAWIAGRYEVLDVFGGPGKSGMGVVYKCFDRWDRQLRALKSFQDQPIWDAEIARAFQREAELWIDLGHHRHIVAARTIRKPDGRFYLVLEYIEPDEQGRNCLSQYLTGSPLPLEQVLTWAVQFCWGMEYALDHGVRSHRDVKPDNIMIDREGRVKITDFGLARAFDALPRSRDQSGLSKNARGLSIIVTSDGATCGSPPWMAPEQFGGAKHADARNDIYSLGIVLYQLLTGGILPFVATSVQQFANLHRHAPVPAIESPLAPIIERCLAKRPEHRYRDFTALRQDVETYASHLGIHVPPYQDLPETAERLKDRASSLCYLQRCREAVGQARQAVHRDRKLVAAWINRSLCHVLLSDVALTRAQTCIAARHANLAVRCAQEAIRLDPDSALAHNNLAGANRCLGDSQAAISAARRSVELDPCFIDGWNTLGELHHRRGQAATSGTDETASFQEAVRCYCEALRIDPFFVDGYMNLASSLSGLGDAEGTLNCYETAVIIDPGNSLARERRDAFRKALERTGTSLLEANVRASQFRHFENSRYGRTLSN